MAQTTIFSSFPPGFADATSEACFLYVRRQPYLAWRAVSHGSTSDGHYDATCLVLDLAANRGYTPGEKPTELRGLLWPAV